MKHIGDFSMIRMIFSWCCMMLAHQVFAANQVIECPAQMPIKNIQINDGVDSWIQQIKSPMPLTGAGFMQAPPEKMAYLKPSSTNDSKNRTTVIWKFEGDYPLGKWLTCDYSDGVGSMSKEIDRNVTECVVTYAKNKDKNRHVSVSCQ
jgi:hypothetical protein